MKSDTGGSKVATLHQSGEGDITLSLNKEKFAEFFFSFLGAKETLSKIFNTDFVVRMQDLLQFHYLITQKIEKEQFIHISLVTAAIRYDDDTSRTINTFEAMEKYYEYRDVDTQSINITWNFVFKSPNENNIHQQKISLFFETRNTYSKTGSVTVAIEHTNQVWATEVMHLFEEQIRKISAKYSIAYRSLRTLKELDVAKALAVLCVPLLLAGLVYILIQKDDLRSPLKVKNEFIFDITDVLVENKNDADLGLILQFFLLRDLQDQPTAIIAELQKAGYFNPKYSEIIEKYASGYYFSNKESDKLSYTIESVIRQANAILKINEVSYYLRFVLLYAVAYALSALYLRVFKMQSVLALTNKGVKRMEKQEKDSSTLVQFIFGVLASLVAALIYQYAIEVILIK